jgi:cytochrome c556
MRSGLLRIGIVIGVLFFAWQVSADDHKDLPAGPIRDRHELMEQIGLHAKKIGEALKSEKRDEIAIEADLISADAKKIEALFPAGSTDPNSRAKPEIWTNWAEFQTLRASLQSNAEALAASARRDGDVREAAKTMFETCKSCHEKFRVPDED